MKYHVNAWGGDTEAFKKGFVKALELTFQSEHKSLLIRIGLLDNARGIMMDVLGEKFTKKLIKEKAIDFTLEGRRISINLEGDRTRRTAFRSGVIFCPWAAPDTLLDVIQDYRQIDMVYVPWMEKERDDYIISNPDSVEI
ncbi:hypothetical protein [Vreelandella aquamarina]|uniref:Uncharacterized protein n=1 Tax=Vreelandella aquamarina TaxID=77097 RepID=A0A857GKC0_9GAMM|nr:hypothetical protein [Halomonas meridiana]QHD49047.1 hypothetical protein CTT34_04720 [Halomonas meridiana]